MILLSLVAAALAAATPDPCAAVSTAALATPDAAAAATYRAVGDAELAAGNRTTAAFAYREALARDPGDARARASLDLACAPAEDTFARGMRLMRSGDRRGAVVAFESARAAGDPSATLMEGICLYELGEDGRADPLLAEAAEVPEHRETAEFFRGLVALRTGRSGEAVTFLERSSADPSLGTAAASLARVARQDGKLVLSLLAQSGWDSNVDLTPDGQIRRRAGIGTSDANAGITGVLRLSPLGETGPFVRGMAQMQDQFQYNTLDLRGFGGAAGWQLGRGARHLIAEYAYERRDLDGEPYLSAQHLLGSGRLPVSPTASLGATYLARWESYSNTTAIAAAPYTGLRQVAVADATFALGDRFTVTIAAQGGRDGTRDRSLSYWELGPRAGVRVALSRRARLSLDAAVLFRPYDLPEQGLSVARSDVVLNGGALVELDLGERFTAQAGVVGWRNQSNVADYTYSKLVPTVGLAYTAGIF
jgi:tetratricopeptide (TPR) repeat protein